MKKLNEKERNGVLQFSRQYLKNDKLSQRAINAASIKFNVYCRTMSCLWKLPKTSKIKDDEIYNVVLQKNFKCG